MSSLKARLVQFIVLIFILTANQVSAYDDKDLLKFKATNECEKCDLSGSNFLESNLRGANLKDANLQGAFLRLADFRGADLRGADLRKTNFILANLSDADLTGANLIGAVLTDANLIGAVLTDANLSGAALDDVLLKRVDDHIDSLKNASELEFILKNASELEFIQSTLVRLGTLGDSKAIPTLVKYLNDKNIHIKKIAIEALGEVRVAAAIKSLVEFLQDENVETEHRRLALIILGTLGDSRAIPTLVENLNDKNIHIKKVAIEALGEIGDPAVIKSLVAFLQDENVETRLSAIHALSEIGDSAAISVLVENLTGKKINNVYKKNNSISIDQNNKIELTIASLEEKTQHPDRSMEVDLNLILYLHAFRTPSSERNSKIESIKKTIGAFLDNEVYGRYVYQELPEKVYATPYDGTDHSLLPLIQWVSSAVIELSTPEYKIPCVIIKKRPGLLNAIDPLFAAASSSTFHLSGCEADDLNGFPEGLTDEYEIFSLMLDGNFSGRYRGSLIKYILRHRAPLRASMPFINGNNDLSKMGVGSFRFPYETWSYMSQHNRKHFEEIGLRFSILKCLLTLYYVESFGSPVENAFKLAGKKLFDLTFGAYCGDGRPRVSLRTLLLEGGSLSSIKSFVKHNPEHFNGGHIDLCEDDSGINPLIHIATGNFDALKFLWALPVESGGLEKDIESPNMFYKTSLMTAVQFNFIESVRFLLKNGANVNAITDSTKEFYEDYQLIHDRRSPLMYAAANSSLEMIKLLLENGADPNMVDSQGYSALDYLRLELVGANTTISKKDKILAIKLLEKLTAPYLSKEWSHKDWDTYYSHDTGHTYYFTESEGHKFGFVNKTGDCDADILRVSWPQSQARQAMDNLKGRELSLEIDVDGTVFLTPIRMVWDKISPNSITMSLSDNSSNPKFMGKVKRGDLVKVSLVGSAHIREHLHNHFQSFSLLGFVANQLKAKEVCNQQVLRDSE